MEDHIKEHFSRYLVIIILFSFIAYRGELKLAVVSFLLMMIVLFIYVQLWHAVQRLFRIIRDKKKR